MVKITKRNVVLAQRLFDHQIENEGRAAIKGISHGNCIVLTKTNLNFMLSPVKHE